MDTIKKAAQIMKDAREEAIRNTVGEEAIPTKNEINGEIPKTDGVGEVQETEKATERKKSAQFAIKAMQGHSKTLQEQGLWDEHDAAEFEKLREKAVLKWFRQ